MKDVYTDYSPAFFSFVESIAEEKGIKLMNITGRDSKWVNFFKDSSQSDIRVITALENEEIAFGSKVTQGEFLDALVAFQPAPKTIIFNSTLLGRNPILIDYKLHVGCKIFDIQDVLKFAKEYKEWQKKPGKIKFPDCHTDSSTELRAYAKSICPSDIENSVMDPQNRYNYLALYSWCGGMSLSGEPVPMGKKLSASQFIAQLEEAKPKKEIKNLTCGKMIFILEESGINAGSHGFISHQAMEYFLGEFAAKTK